jgi:hypothetical protein
MAMTFDEDWRFFGIVAIGVAVLGSIFYRAIIWYILERWGKSTKGVVLRSLAQNDDGSVVYVVSYEFSAVNSDRKQQICIGKYTTEYNFQAKDVIAVRYLSTWPRINRIVERAV